MALNPKVTPDGFQNFFSPRPSTRLPHSGTTVPPRSLQHRPPSPVHLIFFIPGNPGLIGYYHTFLSLLCDGLYNSESKAKASAYLVYGASLSGFQVDPKARSKEELLVGEDADPQSSSGQPYTLREQVTLTHRWLRSLIWDLSRSSPAVMEYGLEVTLIGHSAGTYIALEVLRLIRTDFRPNPQWQTPARSINVKSLILITPTVIDIPLSPNGRIAVALFRWMPFLPQLAQGFMRAVSIPLPQRFIRWLVGRFVDDPDIAETAVNFLTSKGMIRQAL